MSDPDQTPPTFTRLWPSGALTVDHWPDRMHVKIELLGYARCEEFELAGDELVIRCANGEATYRVVGLDPATGLMDCVALRRAHWDS